MVNEELNELTEKIDQFLDKKELDTETKYFVTKLLTERYWLIIQDEEELEEELEGEEEEEILDEFGEPLIQGGEEIEEPAPPPTPKPRGRPPKPAQPTPPPARPPPIVEEPPATIPELNEPPTPAVVEPAGHDEGIMADLEKELPNKGRAVKRPGAKQ